MALPNIFKRDQNKIPARVILLLLVIVLLPPKSVGLMSSTSRYSGDDQKERELRRELILGSRPPGCVNKCLSCHPCLATLVIPPPHRRSKSPVGESLDRRGDGTAYYLLSWKCRCGNKLFQP